jgi:hypothetical protein
VNRSGRDAVSATIQDRSTSSAPAAWRAEHENVVLGRGARGGDRECASELAEVVGVLDDVEPERFVSEAAVGVAGQEGVVEDLSGDVLDRCLQLACQGNARHRTASRLIPTSPPAATIDPVPGDLTAGGVAHRALGGS